MKYFEDSEVFGRHMQKAPPYPDIIQLEITSVCNLQCIMCPIVTESRHREPHERVLTLENLRGMEEIFRNAYEVELSGFGEAFTHPQILDVLRYFREMELVINATSNGMLIDEQKARAIVEENLMDLLCVSLDSARPETYRKIRVGGDLETIVANVRRLSEIKSEAGSDRPEVHLSYITMADNIEQMPEVVDIAAQVGATEVVIQGLNESWLTADQNTARYRELEADAYKEAARRARDRNVELEFWYQGSTVSDAGIENERQTVRKYQTTSPIHAPDRPLVKDCPFPWDRVFIKSNKDVQICATLWEEMVMGNLRDQSFSEIWTGEKYRRARDQMRGTDPPPECRKCMTKHWRIPLLPAELSDSLDFGDLYTSQLGLGFYPLERDDRGTGHRWLKQSSTFFLKNTGKVFLDYEMFFHPKAPGIEATLYCNDRQVQSFRPEDVWKLPLPFAVPPTRDEILRFDLVFDRTWTAAEVGEKDRFRPLTARAHRAALRLDQRDLKPFAQAEGNGEDQFGWGWYEPEPHLDGFARWCSNQGVFVLDNSGERALILDILKLEGVPPQKVNVEVNGRAVSRFATPRKPGPGRVRIALPRIDDPYLVVRIAVEPAWSPAESGHGYDSRRLGLLMRRAAMEKAGIADRLTSSFRRGGGRG